MNDYR